VKNSGEGKKKQKKTRPQKSPTPQSNANRLAEPNATSYAASSLIGGSKTSPIPKPPARNKPKKNQNKELKSGPKKPEKNYEQHT